MKHIAILLSLFTFHSSLFTLSASAALPVKWDVELTAQPPQVFTLQRPRGETYELEAVLKMRGKPFEPAITNACIYWQTNGMENLYWSAPASVSNHCLRATWLPSMDPGATTVRGYIGDPGHIYAAAFQFRFIASPGATPNELPLPQKVIDFSKVTVLNPPWPSGSVRPLPPYLHYLEFDDVYIEDARAWYAQHDHEQNAGGCSAVRIGNDFGRNYDLTYDEMPEFVVRVSSKDGRHASVGVANVRTDLTEEIVCSGSFSTLYRVLPGRVVDGINDAGVVVAVNVIPRDETKDPEHGETRNLHPFEVVRHVLDNYASAEEAAEYVADHYYIPEESPDSYHWMIADANGTFLVEDGRSLQGSTVRSSVSNYRISTTDEYGSGRGRRSILESAESVEQALSLARYTNAYEAGWPWPDEFAGMTDEHGKIPYSDPDRLRAWADTYVTPLLDPVTRKPRARGNGCWQSVHSSIYDLTNRTLRIAVQEQHDRWYTFAGPSACADNLYRGLGDEYVYESAGMSSFRWESDRPDALAAVGDQQPWVEYESGGYTEWSIYFTIGDAYYWGYAYDSTLSPEVYFNCYADYWDEDRGEWIYDSLTLVGKRKSQGWKRQYPIDTFAHQSQLTSAVRAFNSMSNTLYSGETKEMRTGEYNQYGTGWGYFRRPLGSDFRSWRIRTPKTSMSGPATSGSMTISSIQLFSGATTYVTATSNPLALRDGQWMTGQRLLETRGSYGSDSVELADYVYSAVPIVAGSNDAYYVNYKLVNISRSPMVFEVTPITDGWVETYEWIGGQQKRMFYRDLDFGWLERRHYQSYSYYYNFTRPKRIYVEPGTCAATNTVPLTFWLVSDDKDGSASDPTTSSGAVIYNLENTVRTYTMNLTFNTSQYDDYIQPAGRVVTESCANLIYDEVNQATFRIAVSNGCAFIEYVSARDWRKEEL